VDESYKVAIDNEAEGSTETKDALKSHNDIIPIILFLPGNIHGKESNRPLLALLDSGSTHSWISHRALPTGIQGQTDISVQSQTLAGPMKSTQVVDMTKILLPEFFRTRVIDTHTTWVFFQEQCRYNLILGRDFILKLGMLLDFQDKTIHWDDVNIRMRQYPHAQLTTAVAEQLLLDVVDSFDDVADIDVYSVPSRSWSTDDNFATEQNPISTTNVANDDSENRGYKSKEILQSKYDKVCPVDVARSCKHLTLEQQNDLASLLSKYDRLFSGELGCYPYETIHLDLESNAIPHRSRPYLVPQAHLDVFKAELDQLVNLGVLEKTGRSEWMAGTFIIPKKDGRVRWVSDFRGLNKYLKRKVYPLPKIKDILQRRRGYSFLTKLDVSMQYYTFELDDESLDLCTIATTFGLYRYKRLPMGVSVAPDVAQEIMEKTLEDIWREIEIYIDDIAAFSNDWQSHLCLLEQILNKLQDAGFTINPLKCEWGVQETDFLGHWLTPTGVRPWKRKVDAILRMQEPTNIKELRSFLGLVNYYRDMWPKRTHVLAPLTDLTGKKAFVWNDTHKAAFKRMKAIIAADALLAFPDPNLPYDIEADASDYQLGAVVKQHSKPVAYYSRKLNAAQKNYTTIEKELLSIVETYKEFRSILLRARITVHTDHKNLSHHLASHATQRVMRWRLSLEEYGPTFRYKKGEQNIIADALSRVPAGSPSEHPEPQHKHANDLFFDDVELTHAETAHTHYNMYLHDPSMADCLLEHPVFDDKNRHPFHFKTISAYQQQDKVLWALPSLKPKEYEFCTLHGAQLVCTTHAKWQICVSDEMLPKLVTWYHTASAHVEGMTRLYETLSQHFFHPNLLREVRKQVSSCDICQRLKRASRQYRSLASRDVVVLPWHEVQTDCIGPWSIPLRGNRHVDIQALTTIDTATNLLEINRLTTKTLRECAQTFSNNWLS